ncbi:hypothetical protein FQN54_004949 [Arachnomyces sp. PD_36]|nr:hypothetical protein FQN54_004949 [Arachnomyces sp. PD_36]
MGKSFFESLFAAPEVNPLNRKAKSVPLFNPFDKYGRVFFFSWLGFMVAFMSWYAFPPLSKGPNSKLFTVKLSLTIAKDLGMTHDEIANSNIVALLATLLVRFTCGPLCDRFGPRRVFIGTLLCGAIPTAMAGLVTTPNGLIALRFFVGILGATFVPCQVWCTGFFDKNVVGTANALAGGWGNAGGGITYFVMPAVFDSLVHSAGLAPHKAWRVAYIVPFIIITVVALGMLFLCDDTPTGRWSDRHIITEQQTFGREPRNGDIVSLPPSILPSQQPSTAPSISEKKGPIPSEKEIDAEAQSGEEVTQIDSAIAEVVIAPTFKETLAVVFSLQSFALALPYACSFGGELAVNSILGDYYTRNFPSLNQTSSGRWAAMFGLLNVLFRPLGGVIADIIYKYTKSVWAKKLWITFLGVVTGVFAVVIGFLNPKAEAKMFGLIAGFAFFLEAGNGANFAVVPHVHPFANGIVSGFVGMFGNLGGIIFAIVFRYNGTHYSRSIWIIGIISIVVNLAVSWITPIPKGQVSVAR